KQLRTAMRSIQALSIAGTSLGDVFLSLLALFVSINVSKFVLPKVLPGYEFGGVDKVLFWLGWAIILAVILILAAILIFFYYMMSQFKI
ncbi:MAG: hypothetical protein QGG82_01565, partial [Patescibacteria group bacterium]|nr:hypothetical protein [Patescibacteria group bacterium]